MRSSTTTRRRLAGVAAVAALALLATGCATSKQPSAKEAGTGIAGITANTVKIGFTTVDTGSLKKQLGFVTPDFGGVGTEAKAIQAVVAYINANGGMGGRQVTADIKSYRATTDTPQQSQAQCSSYTQDDQVFAVVMDGMFQNNAIPCYKNANTILADETLQAHDQTQFEQYSPYLWSPTLPDYSAVLKAQLTAMNDAGFFKGSSGVLIIPSDDEVSRRNTNDVVTPYLQSIGITKIQTSYVDSSNTGTLGATSAAALTAGKNANLNRVVVVGGARIEPVALSDQKAQTYIANWSVSTYDNPAFVQNNSDSVVTARRVGMAGLGFYPAQDVDQNQGPPWPDTSNPAQQKCYDIVTKAGAAPPENLRQNWRVALQYCDGAFFLKSVLDQLPGAATVTGTQFKDAAGKIGDIYHSAGTFGSQWGPGVYAGTNAGQPLGWDTACSCFKYSGQVVTYGPTATGGGASTPATSSPSTGAAAPTQPAGGATQPIAPIGTITANP